MTGSDLMTEEQERSKKDSSNHRDFFFQFSGNRELYPLRLYKNLYRSVSLCLRLAWAQPRRIKRKIKLNHYSPHCIHPAVVPFPGTPATKRVGIGFLLFSNYICCMVLGFRLLWSLSWEIWSKISRNVSTLLVRPPALLFTFCVIR